MYSDKERQRYAWTDRHGHRNTQTYGQMPMDTHRLGGIQTQSGWTHSHRTLVEMDTDSWTQTQTPMDTPTHMSTDRGRYGQAGLERQADTLTQSGTETDKHGWNTDTQKHLDTDEHTHLGTDTWTHAHGKTWT